MKRFKITKINLVMLLTALLAVSCTDVWEDHYSAKPSLKSELTLYAYISTQPQLSKFAAVLAETGYDSILNKSQTYTVWAPVNSALEGVEGWELTRKVELVRNHITRFSHPTSGLDSKTIFMLDKKFVTFKRSELGFSLGGKALLPAMSNIAAVNGILHVIDGYVPYLNNLWEFIGYAQGLDSLRNYLYSQSSFEFDQNASVEIGTNEFGQAVYDSVITFTNPILDEIGALHFEDSVFTALLPNNKAWTNSYNQIKNGYKTLLKDGGAPQQRLNTQWAIVKNLIFRNRIEDVQSQDSIISTTGSIFKNPAYLFAEATKSELSNGLAYMTDSIRFKPSESWQQPVKIEAENSDFGRSYKFANLYVRSALGSQFSAEISDSKYLVIEPVTVSNTTQNEVTFPIPNTLSGKYRIYCIFVPSNIASPNDVRPCKVSFSLTHLNESGEPVLESGIDSKNKLTGAGRSSATFTTEGDKISKMFVVEYESPYCNLITDKSEATSITTKLRVRNEAKITETVKFNKVLRVDCIILEPVQ